MRKIKEMMAKQIVEQNSLKFEVIEKMNNLANLIQYKGKYGDISQEIDSYYEKVVKNEKGKKGTETSKSSIPLLKTKQPKVPFGSDPNQYQPENVHFNSIRTLPRH